MKNARAFSLIELLVTISILGIIVFLVIPRRTVHNSLFLNTELNNLFTTFTYLQQKATARNAIEKLTVNQKNNTYSYTQEQKSITHTLDPHIRFGFLPDTKGPPATPKKQIHAPVTFRSATVVFFPNGTISPGTIYLTDQEQKNMHALTSSMAPVSYVRKYAYTDGKWCSM